MILDERYIEEQREKRIRHRLRMIAKARRIAATFYGLRRPQELGDNFRGTWRDKKGQLHRHFRDWRDIFGARDCFARKWHDTLAMCSGSCCGNPRRWYRVMSYQEVKAYCSAIDQCEEEGIGLKPSRFRL